ncbi:DUF359 domain-containing protein [Candidatus Micrarchaeota archaeon]|nr:DUF359 domain-containing protein [Candidatus Micrarchaeota archaeon]
MKKKVTSSEVLQMPRISRELREKLKKPLGKVLPFQEAIEKLRGKRIVAVGDEIVFKLLEEGLIPFVSVFDLKTLRGPVEKEVREKLMEQYPEPEKIRKRAGELNREMFEIAAEMLEKGGGLYVEGEEDLFALPFATLVENEVVVYGQPGEGCVILEKKDSGKLEKLVEKEFC